MPTEPIEPIDAIEFIDVTLAGGDDDKYRSELLLAFGISSVVVIERGTVGVVEAATSTFEWSGFCSISLENDSSDASSEL